MIKIGFLLCSQDNTYSREPVVTTIGFSTNRFELEKELEILEKDYSDRLERFEEQSENCIKYVEKFDKAWNKYEQKNVIPYHTPGITRPTTKPYTKEEHAEYKRIKDFNISNGDKNRALNHREKCNFLLDWRICNPSGDSFREFIEVSECGSEILITNDEDNTSYFICELGKEVSEEF